MKHYKYKRGTQLYVPPLVLKEIDEIMQADKLNKRADALRRMAEHSIVGREVEKIAIWTGIRKRR